jgi:hypothetical protein
MGEAEVCPVLRAGHPFEVVSSTGDGDDARRRGSLCHQKVLQAKYDRPMRALLLLTCLLVTGCTATSTYQANIDDANCQAAGAKFGSKDYYQCRDKLQAARQ